MKAIGGRTPRWITIVVPVFLLSAVFAAYASADNWKGTEPNQTGLTLRVGVQDDIQTKSLFGHLLSPDVWTSNVLGPLYGGVLQTDPATNQLLPYIARGVDFDEDGMLGASEVGVFAKDAGADQRTVTVYYDLNGVKFHDGSQATVEDLLFSYHSQVKLPTTLDKDVIKDMAGLPGSNYTATRWLHLYKMDNLNVWEDEGTGLPSTDPYRVALQFRLQGDYYNFYRKTVEVTLVPRYIWEGTGSVVTWSANSSSPFAGQTVSCTHADWGLALDAATWNGVPEGSGAWDLSSAAAWTVPDSCMIGTGPFLWEQWIPGAFASIIQNPEYFVTVDASGYEYLHPPFLDGMRYQIYKTIQAAVFALQANEIDVISWSIPPGQLADLQNNPDITVTSNTEKGFTYLAYNMQIAGGAPWAYQDGDPSKPDMGIPFRQAVAHTIDKTQIVTALLQNFGVKGDGVVSPMSTMWYNASLPQYDFDLIQAEALLDAFSTDPAGTCQIDGTGCRSFAGIGTSLFDIQCPQADYDPIQAASCSMIETQMRAVGINVEAKHLAFSQITQNLDNRDMRLWLLESYIEDEPPDYMDAFFHSRNYPDAENFAGYANPVFDQVMNDARADLNFPSQSQKVKLGQGIISTELPYDVLYYRTNIEAYRNDRTTNWTVGPFDSIFRGSYWSWIGVRPPSFIPVAKNLGVSGFLAGSSGILHILSSNPVLNWTYTDPENDPQAEFQVRVGTAPGLNDMWAPGIQAGSVTTVVYAGAPLADASDYYFGVSVSDGAFWSPWREVAFHTNGIPPVPTTPVDPPDMGTIDAGAGTVVSWTSGGPDPETDPVTYQWEVSADPLFTPLIASGSTPATESSGFSTAITTTHYWRVRACDGWECSAWSAWRFTTTATINNPPVASFPGVDGYPDGSVGILHILTTSPILSWTYSDPEAAAQVEYEVRVGSAPGLDDRWKPGPQVGPATTVGYAGAPLADGTDHYFGVRVSDGVKWSAWTEVMFHTNAAPSTYPISPPDNAANVPPGGATLVWNATTDPEGDAITYHWYLSTASDFSTLVDSGTTTLTSAVVAVVEATAYFWRVQTWDGWEFSANSTTFRFTTASTPPTTGAILGGSADPGWNPIAGAVVQLLDSDGNTVGTVTTAANGTFAFLDIPFGTYAIRLTATGYYDVTVEGVAVSAGAPVVDVGMIAMNPIPNEPPLVTFVGVDGFLTGSQGILHILPNGPAFNWTYVDPDGDPQTGFEIRVGTSPGLENVWASGVVSGVQSSVPYGGPPLDDGTDYHLSVRVSDGGAWSEWAEVLFHTNTPPPVPTPAAPVQRSTAVVPGSVLLAWDAVIDSEGDIVTYYWYLSTEDDFSTTEDSGNTLSTWTEVAAEQATRYTWRVRAWDGWEFSENSTVFEFTTGGVPPDEVSPPPLWLWVLPAVVVLMSVLALLYFRKRREPPEEVPLNVEPATEGDAPGQLRAREDGVDGESTGDDVGS